MPRKKGVQGGDGSQGFTKSSTPHESAMLQSMIDGSNPLDTYEYIMQTQTKYVFIAIYPTCIANKDLAEKILPYQDILKSNVTLRQHLATLSTYQRDAIVKQLGCIRTDIVLGEWNLSTIHNLLHVLQHSADDTYLIVTTLKSLVINIETWVTTHTSSPPSMQDTFCIQAMNQLVHAWLEIITTGLEDFRLTSTQNLLKGKVDELNNLVSMISMSKRSVCDPEAMIENYHLLSKNIVTCVTTYIQTYTTLQQIAPLNSNDFLIQTLQTLQSLQPLQTNRYPSQNANHTLEIIRNLSVFVSALHSIPVNNHNQWIVPMCLLIIDQITNYLGYCFHLPSLRQTKRKRSPGKHT